MKTVIRKATVITLVILGFCILGLTILLDENFYRTRRRQPELESGRIYPEVIHGGARVYLTRLETSPFEYSWYICGTVIAIAFVLNQHWRCFP